MQAIILAAGMGKRLGHLTQDHTKCMVKVNGTSLIDRVLTQLSALSLSRIVIVVGYKGADLRNYIGNEYNGTKIEYLENTIYDSTNNIYSLALAHKEMKEDDTLLLESDLIFDSGILQRLIETPAPNLAVVARYAPWMDGTCITQDEEHRITAFVSKKEFDPSLSADYYKTANIYKFSREFDEKYYLPFLQTYMQAFGANDYYEQVLRLLSFQDKNILRAFTLLPTERWYEIDTEEDLREAEKIFL